MESIFLRSTGITTISRVSFKDLVIFLTLLLCFSTQVWSYRLDSFTILELRRAKRSSRRTHNWNNNSKTSSKDFIVETYTHHYSQWRLSTGDWWLQSLWWLALIILISKFKRCLPFRWLLSFISDLLLPMAHWRPTWTKALMKFVFWFASTWLWCSWWQRRITAKKILPKSSLLQTFSILPFLQFNSLSS